LDITTDIIDIITSKFYNRLCVIAITSELLEKIITSLTAATAAAL